MGTALVTLKIMPASPETDLESIKEKTKSIIEEGKGEETQFKEEPVAFGLKAVIASFSIDEDNGLDPIENKIKEIEEVNSCDVIDMRRAFG